MLSPYLKKQTMSLDLCPYEHCKRETEARNDLTPGRSSHSDTHLSQPAHAPAIPLLSHKFAVKTPLNFRRGRMDPAATSSPPLGCTGLPAGQREVALPMCRTSTCPGLGCNRNTLARLTPECQSAKRFRLHISLCLNKNSLCPATRLGIILDKMFSTAVCSAAGETLG